MENHDAKKDKNERSSKGPSRDKKELEKFLAGLCEAKGLGKPPRSEKEPQRKRMACKCPCADAEWRAQLDIHEGVLCVYSKVSREEADGPHRDVTLAVTYVNEDGEEDYMDITFCDAEIRWIMEALWHAPIWE